MLFAVPDAVVCTPPAHQHGCDPSKESTSFRNRFYGNIMGVAPGGKRMPNGTDFWWDSNPGNTANCWYSNIPAKGKQITTSPPPPLLPGCNGGKDPSSSVGTGWPPNQEELGACAVSFESGNYDPNTCPWFRTPPKPSG